MRKLHQLHFLKLVLPDDAAHILPIRACLAAEAWCVGGKGNRQAGLIEHLIAIQIRDRHFRRRNQPQILLSMRHAKRISRKLRQLPRAVHRIGIHQVGRKNFGVSVLARMQIEHEVRERPLELRAQIPVHRKARPGQLHGAFQVEDPEISAQIPMWLGSEIKFRRRAPAPDFYVVIRAVPNRHARVRQVGNAGKNLSQPRVQIGCSLLQLRNPLAQFLRLRHRRAGVLPAFLQLGNLFRSLVSLRLACLSLSNGLPAVRIHLAEVLEHRSRIHAALAQLLFNQWQVFTNKIQIEHGNLILYRKRAAECTPARRKPGRPRRCTKEKPALVSFV